MTNTATRTIDLSDPSLEPDTSFAKRLSSYASDAPDRTAIVGRDRRVSWRRLWEEVRDVAAFIGAHTRPEACAAILAENRPEYVTAFMGIAVAGRCAVTIPTALPGALLEGLLRDSSPEVLFVSKRFEPLAREALAAAGRSSSCRMLVWSDAAVEADSWSESLATGTGPRADEIEAVPLDRPFNIVYSSGTTGAPKGIVHSHRTRIAMSRGLDALGFDRAAVALVSTPLYTNFAIPATLGILWSGGRVVLMERFDESRFLALAEREHATHFYLVPTQVQRLLESPEFRTGAVAASRLVYVGGSLFLRELKDDLVARWPGPILEVYGMTEGAPASALWLREFPHKRGSVGRPVQGCEIRIIDESGRELSPGESGEIVGRSGAMMVGYHRRPDATADLCWYDQQGQRFFRSGDIGRFDEDGFLYILDRMKDMIISGGLNIYAADLEAVLGRHPEVAEAAVVGLASARWGESPVACVVLRPGAQVVGDTIMSWANAQLARHQRLVTVHCLERLPRNAMGKVLKRELRSSLPPLVEAPRPRGET